MINVVCWLVDILLVSIIYSFIHFSWKRRVVQAERRPLSQWLFTSLTYLILSNNQIPNHILVRYGMVLQKQPLKFSVKKGLLKILLANFNHHCSTMHSDCQCSTTVQQWYNHHQQLLSNHLAPPTPLFLMDNMKMDGIQIKIKWKIHVLFTL